MSVKHLNEEQLILYHYSEEAYREPGERRAAADHLAACETCRANYARLERLLAAVNSVTLPERDENYGSEVWARLRPRLKFEPAGRAARGWSWWLAPQRWALAGAIAAMLLVAFLAGRFLPRQVMPPEGHVSEQVRERILLVAVGEHLERSQMVLIELENTPVNGKVDISSEQRAAGELVGANRLYRQTALNAGETGMASVLEELERVLVEIANSPSEVSSKELEKIHKRIESQGILFKVRVIGSQVRERAQPAPAGPIPETKSGSARKMT